MQHVSWTAFALQEQLINKDIPFLSSALPDEFSAVLVKGRSNYVGLRRLAQTSKRQELLFADREQLEQLWQIEDWAYKTTDGSRADLPVLPRGDVWDRVRSEHGNCMGRRCTYYGKCHYQHARRRDRAASGSTRGPPCRRGGSPGTSRPPRGHPPPRRAGRGSTA